MTRVIPVSISTSGIMTSCPSCRASDCTVVPAQATARAVSSKVFDVHLSQGAPVRRAVVRPMSGVPGGKGRNTMTLGRRPAFVFLLFQEAEERICAFAPCGHTVCEGCAMQIRGRRRPARCAVFLSRFFLHLRFAVRFCKCRPGGLRLLP